MTTCTAECGTGTWDNNNVCTALTTCGNQIIGGTTPRTTVTNQDGTATTDNVCSVCNDGSFGATSPGVDCMCDAGTWLNTDECTACTAVPNANTVTCTLSTDSVAETCNAGTWVNAGGCFACTAVSNAATVTCTHATDSIAMTCDTGSDLASGACIARVSHIIALQGISAAEFNSDPSILKSFREAVAASLSISPENVTNVKATSSRRRLNIINRKQKIMRQLTESSCR
jgi:hypothetical protein